MVAYQGISYDAALYWKKNDKLCYGTIDDLFSDYIRSNTKDEFYVLSGLANTTGFSRDTIEIGWSKVLDMAYNDLKPVWRITLRGGKSIEVTESHDLQFESLDDVVSVDNYGIMDGEDEDEPMDHDFCTMLGYWMANGSYLGGNGKNNGLHMSTDRSDELSDWFRTFSTRYSRQVETSLNSMMTAVYSENIKGRICLCSVALGRKVEQFFDRSVDCYTKCVPKKILVANNASIAAFLKGYFSGDGCLYVNHLKGHYDYYTISCLSVSRKLLDGISVLLARLNIQHTIDRNGRINPGGYHSISRLYTLNINHGPSVNRFMESVGFIQKKVFTPRNITHNKSERPISMRGIRKIEYAGEKDTYSISTTSGTFVAAGISLRTISPICTEISAHPIHTRMM